MNAKELHASAERMGVTADPRAARPFRLAAVRLSDEQPDTDAHRAAATEAASLLVGLALADAGDDLRRLLTPDPAAADVIWTVACYQIGDLTPSAIRDFPDPVEAVATVAACPEEAHVAAELVASTAQGLRWTAVLRTHDLLSFQLPSADTASDASREHPGDLSAALKRWRDRLADWSAHAGHERDTETVGFAQLGALDVVSSSHPAIPEPSAAMAAATSRVVEERFGALEQRLSGLESLLTTVSNQLASFASAEHRRELAMSDAVRAINGGFTALASIVHESAVKLERDLGDRIDTTERRVVTTVRDSAHDTNTRVRDVSERVSTARRGVEGAIDEQMGAVLLGMRAGLRPLTNEVVQRVSSLERRVKEEVGDTTALLLHEMALLSEAVASLQQEQPAAPAEPALDIRS